MTLYCIYFNFVDGGELLDYFKFQRCISHVIGAFVAPQIPLTVLESAQSSVGQ